MLKKVQAERYWSGMTVDIRHLVNTCKTGHAAKHSNPVHNKNRQRLLAGQSWQVVSINILGSLTQTPKGNTAILVLSDPFTKCKDSLPYTKCNG